MKKILLSVIAICFSVIAFGQTPCNFPVGRTLHTSPGVYSSDPVNPSNLPDGTIGTSYDEIVEVVLPQDTVYPGFGTVPVCFIQVDSVKYLAQGLSFTCGEHTPGLVDPTGPSTGCKWKVIHTPGTVNRGCVIITGTPTTHTQNPMGNDTLQIWIAAGAGVMNPLTAQCSTLFPVKGVYGIHHYVGGTGVALTGANAPDLSLSLTPNPTNGEAQFSFELPDNAKVNVAIYDLMGRNVMEVFAGNEVAGRHSYKIDADKLASGVYTLRVNLNNNSSAYAVRMLVD